MVRPGEKMTEELIGVDEVLLPTTFSGISQLSYASASKNVHWNFVIAGLAENMRNKSEENFVMDLLGAVNGSESVNNKATTSLSASITTEIISAAPSAQPSFPASAGQVNQASLKRDFE